MASMLVSTSAWAQAGVALEKVTFDKENQEATNIARAMYQPEFGYVSAQRIWLRDPAEGAIDQIAVKIGQGVSCSEDCHVAVLYHTDGEWAELWRGEGKTFELGQINEITGLKSIFADNREWSWGGAKYEPSLYGGYPPRRPANEAEMRLATDWIKANYADELHNIDAPQITALDVNLMTGDEKLIFIFDLTICGNDACPVLAVDNGKVLQQFSAIGPDAGIADGRTDQNGYRLIEIQTDQDVSVVSPSTGEVVQHILAQDVIPAGAKRVIAEAPAATQVPELPQ
ncbi:hypothetical protein [Aureimonas pseudogalii]|uniref:Uncharacterized protein n=1 Tax=Aureimonas pseudogalii TaxID=1744844 RepID=A0A7W6MLS8_9HYPH|nr:hypothetical protein [Aureimonas pseudogalii]MBB4000107.1 hypothetical protein [Aureimonas pseudogalii]